MLLQQWNGRWDDLRASISKGNEIAVNTWL